LPVSYESLALAALVITCGFFVFGFSGFGSALLTIPVVSHLWPMQMALPVLALLDFSAALVMGARHHGKAERGELIRMVPMAVLGGILGTTLLVNLPKEAGMAALGLFVSAYGVYSFRERGIAGPISGRWAYVSGITGGSFGGLFGIGGAPYAIYLSRRIPDKAILRATLLTMVTFSVGSRLTLYTLAGLVLTEQLTVALVLLPFAMLGMWAGGRAHLRVSREQLGRVISLVLIGSGISLLARALF
jgi:uncharacterized membrane protein YfcA